MPSWYMFNIDDRERADGVNGKLPEFIFDNHEWIVKLLACRTLPSDESPEEVYDYYTKVPNDKRHELGALSVLPPELISTIFLHVKEPDDVICLAVTHRLLGYEGYRAVADLRYWEWYYHGSWRGARIITLSSEAERLPRGVLSDVEEDDIWRQNEGQMFWYEMGKRMELAAPYDLSEYYRVYRLKPALDRVSRQSGDELRVRLLKETSPHYAQNATWALCNLDTGEYIRANALAEMKMSKYLEKRVQVGSYTDGPFVRGKRTIVDLGTLAILLTASPCWMDGGEWAGHRLKICEVEELPEDESWEDVSQWGVEFMRQWVSMNDQHLY